MNPKTFIHAGIACATLALLAAGPAHGQAASAPEAPVAAKAVIGVTVAQTQLLATGYRATKLIKQAVYNDKGEKIGTVDDLVVSADGTLSTAIVNVGGFLGLGKHLVAIPVKQFTSIAPKAVLPKASKEELKALPKFEYV
ncbi:MAG: PRC-barrel domain-containing protein [Rhodocyclaceae bacterium]|nr:PRC-barrel domain-containing protein [Pseudomonadota bacterium]MDQ7971369.1 PRC-barrel domain-containing protein [Rhodocyclaceae bacterium]MDQ8001551.1 PRC-barrel domain-containing protein [Pseudomonadota bacterium]MDQ8015530.1 PRC-barrel domain-containing protein [Pseudomonadota bacterium]